ncbi:MAG: prolipoprotein diacylglyceryl transferase [Clostridia bacterium]|nr:prolipoprotein diacylglyceryl transferase [Clostridia bacterium]
MKDPHFDVAFTIGKFTIYWYAILLALGIALAVLITDRRTKGRQLPKDIALDLCILGVPFGVLGARLFACVSRMVKWSDFFDLTRPGMSFFGGAILAALAMLVYLKLRKVDWGDMLDAAAPGTFTGVGVAVWGDFFNRSHYGPLVEKTSHKWFPLATFGDDLRIHYAAFFYEFLLCVILIVLYYALFRKLLKRKADRFLLMTLLYCLGRFGIDSIRQGLIMVGPLAFEQICEIVIAILCLFLLLLKRQPPKKDEGIQPVPSEPVAEPNPEPTEVIEPEMKEEEAPAAGEKENFSGLD